MFRRHRDSLKLPERFRDDDLGWAEYDLGGPCFGIERVDETDEEGRALAGRFVGGSLRVEEIDAPTQQRLTWQGCALFTFAGERISDVWALGDLTRLEAQLRRNQT